jgi:hypothetical protein
MAFLGLNMEKAWENQLFKAKYRHFKNKKRQFSLLMPKLIQVSSELDKVKL